MLLTKILYVSMDMRIHCQHAMTAPPKQAMAMTSQFSPDSPFGKRTHSGLALSSNSPNSNPSSNQVATAEQKPRPLRVVRSGIGYSALYDLGGGLSSRHRLNHLYGFTRMAAAAVSSSSSSWQIGAQTPAPTAGMQEVGSLSISQGSDNTGEILHYYVAPRLTADAGRPAPEAIMYLRRVGWRPAPPSSRLDMEWALFVPVSAEALNSPPVNPKDPTFLRSVATAPIYVYRVLTVGGGMAASHPCTTEIPQAMKWEQFEKGHAQYWVFEARNPKVAGVWKKEQFCT